MTPDFKIKQDGTRKRTKQSRECLFSTRYLVPTQPALGVGGGALLGGGVEHQD